MIVKKELTKVAKKTGVAFPKPDIEGLLSVQLNPFLLERYFVNPTKNAHVAYVLNEKLTVGQILALQNYYCDSDNEYESKTNTKSKTKSKSKTKDKNKNKIKKAATEDDMSDDDMDSNNNEREKKVSQEQAPEVDPGFTQEYEKIVAQTDSQCTRTIPIASYVTVVCFNLNPILNIIVLLIGDTN